jgi:hypothetical protein
MDLVTRTDTVADLNDKNIGNSAKKQKRGEEIG